jgi:hypothetical protein
MDALHGGWFRYYAFQLPARHPLEPSMWLGFWTRDTLPWLPLPFLLGLAAFTYRVRTGDRRGAMSLALGTVGMLGTAWSSRLHSGGWDNVLMPAGAWLALLLGLGLGYLQGAVGNEGGHKAIPQLQAGTGAIRGILGRPAILILCLEAACLVQFGRLAYQPSWQIPGPADEEAGYRMVAVVKADTGSVFIPEHGYLAAKAGKPPFAHSMAILDVLRRSTGVTNDTSARKLAGAIDSSLRAARFSSLWLDAPSLDGPGIFPEGVYASYRLSDSLPYEKGRRQFMTRTGIKTRPAYLFHPNSAGK